MSRHTALLDIPELCRAAGVRVVELDGWDTAQGSYFWTLEDGSYGFDMAPSGYMVHHTATSSARPVVRTSSGEWSKANVWAGVERDGRLYSSGIGTPALYFTAAGPARVSSGYGYWPVLADHVFRDIRAPWKAEGPDGSRAANRYVVNVETVHPGDGSPLDPGVHEALSVLGAVLHRHFGWEDRCIGHNSWTRRKIDPYWDDRQNAIVWVQERIQDLLEEDEIMTTARWASRLRVHDINHYAEIGVLAPDEVAYWAGKVEEGHATGDWSSPEWNDLRDAAVVRGPIWGHPGQI